MSANSNARNSLWSGMKAALRWRAKRFLQAARITYLTRRNPEVCIAGVYIPLSKRISNNIKEAMFDGGYETAELRTIAANLAPEDRILEIGTGIGLISTFCAKRVGSERVFTFEANPDLAPLIQAVYARNGVAPKLEFCVLGKGEGEAVFYIHDDFWSSSLYQRSQGAKKVLIPRRDLNELLTQLRPTFLIMDIEGGESEIFEMINLEGINKIAVELHTAVIGQARVDDILNRLATEGFVVDWRYSASINGFKEELFLSRRSA